MKPFFASHSPIRFFIMIFLPLIVIYGVVGWGMLDRQKRAYLQENQRVESQRLEMETRLFTSTLADYLAEGVILADIVKTILSQSQSIEKTTHIQLTDIFKTYAVHHRIFDQIRYIDGSGMEVVRINWSPAKGVWKTPDTELQNKQDRPYFIHGMGQSTGSCYISRFDLNMEHGKVEQPIKPILRMVFPIEHQKGEISGVLVLNLLGRLLIESIGGFQHHSAGMVFLVNDRGQFLKGPSPEMDWQFMFSETPQTMPEKFTGLWNQITEHPHDKIFQCANGLSFYATISPSSLFDTDRTKKPDLQIEAEEGWHIINFIPNDALVPPKLNLLTFFFVAGFIFLSLIAGFASTLMARRVLTIQQLKDKETELETITHSVQDAVIMIDDHGRVVFWNLSAQRIFGFSKDEVSTRDIHELIAPFPLREKASVGMKQFADMGNGEIIGHFRELEALRKDGTRFPAELNVNAVQMENRWWAVGVLRDITERKASEMERKKTEEALKASEQKYRSLSETLEERVKERTQRLETLVETIREKELERKRSEEEAKKLAMAVEKTATGVIITDKNGYIEWFNKGFERISGYCLDEIKGESPGGILQGPETDPETIQLMREALEAEQGINVEILNYHKSGHPYWVEVDIQPIFSDDGELLQYIAIETVITERKKAEEALSAAKDAAEQAARAKGEFLANMSHEIRTPMNAIIGMAYLAGQTDLSPRQEDYINNIETSAKALLSIINDILDFSKIDAGKMTIEQVPFDLRDIINDVVMLSAPPISKKGLDLQISIDDQISPVLMGDPVRLGQVLNNLLNNAVKFTPKGDIEIQIRLVERHSKTEVLECRIMDSGIGMSKEQVDRVFDTFSQADTATTRKYGGTGLGLAICRQLVKLMGGEISVESEQEKGSTFIFTVTLGYQKNIAPSSPYQLLPLNLRNLKVMVIDPNPKNLDNLSQQLKSLSFEVAPANSCHLGVETMNQAVMEKQPFELAIMDYRNCMDEVSSAADGIWHILRSEKIPAIVLAGINDLIEAEKNFSEMDHVHILSKPVLPSNLFNAIVEAFGYKELRIGARRSTLDPLQGKNRNLFEGARILLVEDNPMNQQVARELLEQMGIEVTISDNGVEALRTLQHAPVDLVLMDIQMPKMDGITTTRKIREMGNPVASLPIIAMTANAMVGDREKSLDAGMNDHIAKPVDPERLHACLMKWLPINGHGCESPHPDHENDTDIFTVNGHDCHSAPPGDGNNVSISTAKNRPTPERHATPSESSHPAHLEMVRTLPGIDVTTGLRQVGGNPKLYQSFLRRFSETYRTAPVALEALLSKHQLEEAVRYAHSAKGLAGTVGMKELQTIFFQIEQSLQKDQQLYEKDLEDLKRALERVLPAIDTALSQASSDDEIKSLAPPINPAELPKQIETLKTMLSANDMASEALFQKIKPILFQNAPVETGEMEKMLSRLDFREALALLNKVIEKDDLLSVK